MRAGIQEQIHKGIEFDLGFLDQKRPRGISGSYGTHDQKCAIVNRLVWSRKSDRNLWNGKWRKHGEMTGLVKEGLKVVTCSHRQSQSS